MKKFFIILAMWVSFAAYAQNDMPTDSVPTALEEVVVTADTHIETSKRVIVRPTKLEKEHSSDGYSLLANMNLPDFNVDVSTQTITTTTGRDVKILLNGLEVSPDELATLAASEVVQIDYMRNPGGRYAGSGAVMNFITERYDFGGNVYLSADEGLARQYGAYTGMVSHKKNAVTLAITASGKWDNMSQLSSFYNTAYFPDGILGQRIYPGGAKSRTNSQYLKFKYSHAVGNHALDVSALMKRNSRPKNFMADKIVYSGIKDFTSEATRSSDENGILPAVGLKYNLFLPGGHTLMVSSEVSHGHTSYGSLRTESGFDDIVNNAVENNIKAGGNVSYFKSMAHGLSLGVSLDEYYNYFHDVYSGSFDNAQTLTNNHAMVMVHVDQSLPSGLSYYVSAGMTDLYSTIGTHYDNQLSPMAFYGLTYAVNHRHSFSLTGNYAHSIYDPSYKNDAVIRTSFWEAMMGNPDLEQLKALQNMVSYNGRVGRFGLSFTYDYLKYFGNTSYRYFTENDVMYHRLVNDGDFCYHKLVFGLSGNLMDGKLRLRGNATYSMNRFDSKYRPCKSDDWQADIGVSYMFGDWQVKGTYALPYSVLGVDGVRVDNPSQYGVSLSWRKGNWAAECCVENFVDRRMITRREANYGVYQSVSRSASDLKGRNMSVSVTYMLSYGKKTDRERVETDQDINSAILRPF